MNGKFTQATRDALAAYQEENGFTLRQVGAQVNKSEAYVSRYLSGKPEGDIAAFEKSVADMLENAKRKRVWDDVYFETESVELCRATFNIIRQSTTMGLIYGAAGIGKTTACQRYAEENPTVIFFTGSEGDGGLTGVVDGIASGLDMRKWNPRTQKKSHFVKEKLRGSGRLIIIDNAQRITLRGHKWLNDLLDGKGVAIAMVGNPEVLDKIRGNDQITSRNMIKVDIGAIVKSNWLREAARNMVSAMWPEALADIELLACESARKQGHLRTLNMQLRIAIINCETPKYAGNYAKAFVAARRMIGADATDE